MLRGAFVLDSIFFIGISGLGYLVCGYLLWLYSSRRDPDSIAEFELEARFGYSELLIMSILGLFLEMLMIRWISSEIRIFAYFKNFVLIACFLGFGLGCSLCRRKIFPLTTALPVLFLTVLVGAPIAEMHKVVTSYST